MQEKTITSIEEEMEEMTAKLRASESKLQDNLSEIERLRQEMTTLTTTAELSNDERFQSLTR